MKLGATTLQTLTSACTAGAWSTTAAALTQNSYTVTAAQTDAAGNTGTSAANTFTIDTTAAGGDGDRADRRSGDEQHDA